MVVVAGAVVSASPVTKTPLAAGSGDGGNAGEPVVLGDGGAVPAPVGGVQPQLLVALRDEAALINPLPPIVLVETLPGSALQVAFADVVVERRTDTRYIEEQWTYMQDCLGVSGGAPLLIVTADPIKPLTAGDDVLRHIDGFATASSTASLAGTVLQIWEADFDGSRSACRAITCARSWDARCGSMPDSQSATTPTVAPGSSCRTDVSVTDQAYDVCRVAAGSAHPRMTPALK